MSGHDEHIDLTGIVDHAARAWFNRQQAGRMDAGKNDPATGERWTWDALLPTDQHAVRNIVMPVVVDTLADAITSGAVLCPRCEEDS